MSGKIASNFCQFLDKSPTAFHACNSAFDMLTQQGYEPLSETDSWRLEKGGKV